MTYLIRAQIDNPYIIYNKDGIHHTYRTLRQMIEADPDLILFQNDEEMDRALKQKIRTGQDRPLHKEIQQIVTFLRDKEKTVPRDIRFGYDNLVSTGRIDLKKSRRDVKSMYGKRRFQEIEVKTPVIPKKSRAMVVHSGNAQVTSDTKMRRTIPSQKKSRASAVQHDPMRMVQSGNAQVTPDTKMRRTIPSQKKSRASTVQHDPMRMVQSGISDTKMRKTRTITRKRKTRTKTRRKTKSTKLTRLSSWDNILDHIPCVVEDPQFLGGQYPLMIRKKNNNITIRLFGKKSENCLTMIKEPTKYYLYIKLILFFVDYQKCFPNIQIRPLVFFNQCMNLSLRIAHAMNIEYVALDDHSYITPPTTAQQWKRHSNGEMLDDSQYHPMYQKILNLLDVGMTYYGRYFGFHLLPRILFDSACAASSGYLSPSTIDFFKDLDRQLSIAIHTLAKRYTLKDLYIHQCKPHYFTSQSRLATLHHLGQFLETMPSLSLDTTIQELAHYIRHHIKNTEQVDSIRTLYNLLSLCLFVTPDYFKTLESAYMDLVYRFIGTSTPDWTSMTLQVSTPVDLDLRDLATLMLGTSSFYTFSVRFITQ